MCPFYHLSILLFALLFALSNSEIVTLPHGGQLKGSSINADGKLVTRFLGVRYAKAPIGGLRFEVPEQVEPWVGIRDALKSGNQCVQLDTNDKIEGFPDKTVGNEDCLFLDITIPGGVKDSTSGKLKPVMVFIHGGGYGSGEGASYIGIPLALHGDVVVVSINYRLTILGFLFDGPGTGNFGLWDQRQALLWVKENIAVFGGDPDMVTIFGESAGAGSVVAQMLSKHNDGLFKRAIAQSGSVYNIWSWYRSEQFMDTAQATIRGIFNCDVSDGFYDCLRLISAHDLVTKASFIHGQYIFHPQPDGHFFAEDALAETYELTHRYDLLTGYNAMEGNLILTLEFPYISAMRNESFDDVACTVGMVYQYLHMKCAAHITDVAPELCVEYFINAYDMLGVDDGRERCIKLSEAIGDFFFTGDALHLLSSHSSSARSTYGYYFTKLLNISNEYALWSSPVWSKRGADHGGEIPYVFGLHEISDEMVTPVEEVCNKKVTTLYRNKHLFVDETFPVLSEAMMSMWTNFAKSGNPNEPVQLPDGITWPQFNTDTYQVIQLDDEIKSRQLPNLQRVQKMKSVVMAAVRRTVEKQKSTFSRQVSPPATKLHEEL